MSPPNLCRFGYIPEFKCNLRGADVCNGVGVVFGRFSDRKRLQVPDQTLKIAPSTSRILC